MPQNNQISALQNNTQAGSTNLPFVGNLNNDLQNQNSLNLPENDDFYTDYLQLQIPQEEYLDHNGNDLTKFENNRFLRESPELQKYTNLLIDLQDGTYFGKKLTSEDEMSQLWEQRYYGEQNNQQQDQKLSKDNSTIFGIPSSLIDQNNTSNNSTINKSDLAGIFQNYLNSNPTNVSTDNPSEEIFVEDIEDTDLTGIDYPSNFVDPNLLSNSLSTKFTANSHPNSGSTTTNSRRPESIGASAQTTAKENLQKEVDTNIESQVEKIKSEIKEEITNESSRSKTSNTINNKDSAEKESKDLTKTVESLIGSIKLYGYTLPSSAINKVARSKDPKNLYKNLNSHSAKSWLLALAGKLALQQNEKSRQQKK
ncbi:hypothetical protein IPJ91_02850 [bacterium]|nr:MAG: hypothetical protein IPJ91_02850 [bacterium]